MQCVLTPNPDPPHNLKLIVPAYGSSTISDLTQDEWIERTIERNKIVGVIPSGAEYWVIDETELPGGSIENADSYFFNAWEWRGKVTVNMGKARDIHMANIRRVRNKRLAALDVPFMRAVESNDRAGQQRISVEKQVLRDIPQKFDLSDHQTPATLINAWPSELS